MTTNKQTSPKVAKATSPAQEPTEEQRIGLKAAGGSDEHAVNMELVKRTFATAWPLDGARDDQAAMIRLGAVTRATMAAFEPKDAVEGLLVAQIVGLHHGTMENLRRAVMPTQNMEGGARCYREAASLSQAMVEMMGVLDRRRHPARSTASV